MGPLPCELRQGGSDAIWPAGHVVRKGVPCLRRIVIVVAAAVAAAAVAAVAAVTVICAQISQFLQPLATLIQSLEARAQHSSVVCCHAATLLCGLIDRHARCRREIHPPTHCACHRPKRLPTAEPRASSRNRSAHSVQISHLPCGKMSHLQSSCSVQVIPTICGDRPPILPPDQADPRGWEAGRADSPQDPNHPEWVQCMPPCLRVPP